ncbi:MAG: hypothetical protein R3B07_11360 [Polyangiaceae bacterium]
MTDAARFEGQLHLAAVHSSRLYAERALHSVQAARRGEVML